MLGKHLLARVHKTALVDELLDGDGPLEELSVADDAAPLLELPGEVEVDCRGDRELDPGVGSEAVDLLEALREGVDVELDGDAGSAVRQGDGADGEVAGRVEGGLDGDDASGRQGLVGA